MPASRTKSVPPPRRAQPPTQIPINRLWTALPTEARRKVLRTLSCVLTRQLGPPPSMSEVSHENS